MHKHDLDLIAEYAGGSLRDDSKARALVESCQTCAAEFHAQQAMLTELRGIGPARMTDVERAQLRRDLWTDLRVQTGTEPARGFVSGIRGWALGAAAIVFVAVALVGVLNNIGGGGDAATETFSEIGSGLNSGETRALEDAGDSDGGAGAESADSTSPASESPRFLADEYSNTPYLQIARQVRAKADDDSAYTYGEDELDCLEESGLVDHELVGGFETITDLLVAVPTETDFAQVPVAFVEPELCTVVHIED